MSPTCFEPRGFILRETNRHQKLNINVENCAFGWCVLYIAMHSTNNVLSNHLPYATLIHINLP